MEKRRNNDWTSEQIDFPEDFPEDDLFTEPLYVEPEPISEAVRVMYMKNTNLIYTGVVTGKVYLFSKGGTILDVDKKDAEIMLKRSELQSCCGSSSTPNFELVR